MSEAIELHDSEISSVEAIDGSVHIELSEAYIWADKKGWGQKAYLILEEGEVLKAPSVYPLTIVEGSLKSNDGLIDNIVPLPFSKVGSFTIQLTFENGEFLEISGNNPKINLVGERRFIEGTGDL